MISFKTIKSGMEKYTLSKSLNVFHCASGTCNNCDIEICDCVTPRYDLERFGIVYVGSVRHTDVMFCTGVVTRRCIPLIKRVYEAMPKPGFVVAIGTCSCSQGIFKDSYNIDAPLDEILPVDVYVPGCPPKPEAIIAGIMKLLEKIRRSRE